MGHGSAGLPLDTSDSAVNRYSLETNRKFTRAFLAAYEKLNPHGELVLGSAYLDNRATREKQEHFYRHFGMHVITGEKDSFTASKELMWSQRFTPERFLAYLREIPGSNSSLHDIGAGIFRVALSSDRTALVCVD